MALLLLWRLLLPLLLFLTPLWLWLWRRRRLSSYPCRGRLCGSPLRVLLLLRGGQQGGSVIRAALFLGGNLLLARLSSRFRLLRLFRLGSPIQITLAPHLVGALSVFLPTHLRLQLCRRVFPLQAWTTILVVRPLRFLDSLAYLPPAHLRLKFRGTIRALHIVRERD